MNIRVITFKKRGREREREKREREREKKKRERERERERKKEKKRREKERERDIYDSQITLMFPLFANVFAWQYSAQWRLSHIFFLFYALIRIICIHISDSMRLSNYTLLSSRARLHNKILPF